MKNNINLPPLAYQKSPSFAFYIEPDENVPISNAEFLDGFVRFGAWMRYVQAYQYVQMRAQTEDSFERLIATSGFYSVYGAAIEDIASTMLSWMCWNRYPEMRLADILYLTSFGRDSRAKPSVEYIENLISQIHDEKRQKIDTNVFAESLKLTGAVNTLWMMGLKWKPIPSVKIARTESELDFWGKLPAAIDAAIAILTCNTTKCMGSVYNKIKHGPQLSVINIVDYFEKFGSKDALDRLTRNLSSRKNHPETLRILFEGSRTKNEPGGHAPVNLFLNDDLADVETIFARPLTDLVKPIWLVGMWLRKIHFSKNFDGLPKVVQEAEDFAWEVRAKISSSEALYAASCHEHY
ncbi:hypothetical protein SFMTTN_1732 [Sulfuriferula multivorans]|uniref:Uncharacterized protein n=1 Tax=Sulfuriferula multivorans TaxID=1559896 RepID=A0A401JE35_9PROT|nr:hypothetical protein [Sulfuriferula multivorans]GBL45921.1 hypothetical protein SFMTTN_1732 [Sulfuriferula multivorans]